MLIFLLKVIFSVAILLSMVFLVLVLDELDDSKTERFMAVLFLAGSMWAIGHYGE